MSDTLRLAIFISGGGTTMLEVLRACRDRRIHHTEPALIIASRPGAGGIQKALDEGMKEENVLVLSRKDYKTDDAFGEAILAACTERRVDVIAQCGWLVLTPPAVIAAYRDRIFNQHPGPLDSGRPDFGGQGMYGKRVHAAVIYFARRIPRPFHTEATVHKVAEEYDRGATIGISRVEISPEDDAESLARRVLPYEHRLVIDTLARYAMYGSLPSLCRDTPLIQDDEKEILAAAKVAAIEQYPKG